MLEGWRSSTNFVVQLFTILFFFKDKLIQGILHKTVQKRSFLLHTYLVNVNKSTDFL